MLTIVVTLSEHFDNEKQEFFTETFTLELEHSLATLSKWESIHLKPFLSKDDKTAEEVISYIECMIQTEKYPAGIIEKFSKENYAAIEDFVNAKQTATWFRERNQGNTSGETITAELVYYWMFSVGIDKECEHWHLNKLFTLLRIFSEKNGPQKKMSRSEIAARNREINAKRLAELGTRG